MRTQVAIIGGGPSGLLLGQLLHKSGIDTVILERQSRAHVLGRIRAGVLEAGLVNLMHEAGVGARLKRESFLHHGTNIAYPGGMFHLDFKALIDQYVTVYGQTELTQDLYEARDTSGLLTLHECSNVTLCDIETKNPRIEFTHDGQTKHLTCDIIAGCDGFHGPSRQAIPREKRREFEKAYPFGWMGILSETPPVSDELIYANSTRGFALCSMRNPTLSRYYVQCDLSDSPDNWSDDRFWNELKRRIPQEAADTLITGPSIEKSIAPLRSFVCEPLQWGRLFLCGDAAHIVPPTGAKGLNTAASDVYYLWQALLAFYDDSDEAALSRYSETALARVWKTQRFSWYMTKLLHHFPDQSEFDHNIQQAELAHLAENRAAQMALAQNYVGLPY
ncbi:4-hydroxybenzoate 3-monooxygenase [Roseovarius rhodophyticola]|uniref:4-hydroxybenzoate 3-monooxygenase n=1 Tax=Roseovarius rhodophyticola TaxID=3080827 RepID=A0ABZ2TG97_9RHOB|nr:4-hydroxybenzoate 3-monooxygenase [Roseovarius sp. W115]MDV2931202.1 4-hydroxybenzoate 3-monooxygenase [Roseovarius sp. W115]